MKKLLSCIFFIQVTYLLLVPKAQSQIGQFYTHQDTIAVSTTAVDTVWTTPWTQVSIWADTVDVYAVFGAPDTSSWDSRKEIKITAGSAVTFGPATKLKRLKVRTRTGTGVLNLLGYKTGVQY